MTEAGTFQSFLMSYRVSRKCHLSTMMIFIKKQHPPRFKDTIFTLIYHFSTSVGSPAFVFMISNNLSNQVLFLHLYMLDAIKRQLLETLINNKNEDISEIRLAFSKTRRKNMNCNWIFRII